MAETHWLDDDEQQAWRTMVMVHGRLLARLDAELQRTNNITLPDYELLVHLSEAPDHALRMTELAERLLLSPSGLTRRLDGLVRDGLVERRACPSDRRGSLAVLTAEGLTVLEDAAPTHVNGVRAYVVDRLRPDELMALAACLQRVADALDAAPGPAIGAQPCSETRADLEDRPRARAR